ncbi:MAG: hypothetical protein KA180_03720 [Gemmatimonadales bacterium]|jgi:hypothetical protein|nr:hypothetical protein [Gemmatimonadota bacterium]MBK7784673.1 hypothetical protein [Gemmatimonadota bacterium]MBP6668534.1 hypothetical protein [Gemmatimonadales bacterium]MBP9201713.1 hypothetical protein [Gemmatimonadales bacterium]
MNIRELLAAMKPARTEFHWDPCCFCGQPIRVADGDPCRLSFERGTEARDRLASEYFCHASCFQAHLDEALRTPLGATVERRPDGTITNAASLTADHLTHQRVLCPACGEKVFVRWPEGWDAHAAHRCAGLTAEGPELRKAEFKRRFATLFQS